MKGYWMSVLGDVDGLRWVVKNARMAFTEAMAKRAGGLQQGDRLVLYVGRGAFHNPTRDQAQLAGVATVATPSRRLRHPVLIAGRTFVAACDLDLGTLLPERQGLPIKPMVNRLHLVKRPEVWGQYVRQGLIEITARDFTLLSTAVERAAKEHTARRS